MPLGSDVSKNMEELYASSERPGTKMHALREKHGDEKFRKIAQAAAERAARENGGK